MSARQRLIGPEKVPAPSLLSAEQRRELDQNGSTLLFGKSISLTTRDRLWPQTYYFDAMLINGIAVSDLYVSCARPDFVDERLYTDGRIERKPMESHFPVLVFTDHPDIAEIATALGVTRVPAS